MLHNSYKNHSGRDNLRYERHRIDAEQSEAESYAEEESETFAVIKNCRKVNVREAPNTDADIEAVLPEGTEVMVDEKNSTDDFYKVCNAVGIEGYCMKQYIELRG